MVAIKQIYWMLLSTIMFSLMVSLIKISANHGVVLQQIIFFRGFIPASIIFSWALYKRKNLLPDSWKFHLFRSCSGVISMWLGFFAIAKLNLSTATCLNSTGPIFIAIWNIFHKKYYVNDYLKYLSILLGFLGIVLILQPNIENNQYIYMILGISSGFFTAISMLQIYKLHLEKEPEWRTVLIFSVFICIVSLLFLYDKNKWTNLDNKSFLYLMLIGSFGLFGQLFMTRALSMGPALIPASIQYVTVILTNFIDSIILKEKIGFLSFFGILLVIFAGLMSIFVNYKINR